MRHPYNENDPGYVGGHLIIGLIIAVLMGAGYGIKWLINTYF